MYLLKIRLLKAGGPKMNKKTSLIKLSLVLVFLLSFLCLHAILSYTELDRVEFGNTPIIPAVTQPLSDGKYVSLMGTPSQVFSLAGNEIVFEQDIFEAGRYALVQKGDGDTLFAMTTYGILDIYAYDPVNGLHLISSTDLNDLADNTANFIANGCFALVNGILIIDSIDYHFGGEDQYCRSIVDVSDQLSPFLVSRIYLDPEDWYDDIYKGVYYLNGHYLYITNDGRLYTSDTPTLDPDRLYIFGLEELSFHYAMSIENNIYVICSNGQEEFRFGRLDLSDSSAPTLTLLHSTELRGGFDLSVDSDNKICVTGANGEGWQEAGWQIEKYLYSGLGNWQLLDTASFVGSRDSKLFPITGGYFVAGYCHSMILDGELNVQAILNESSSYYFSDLILERYLVLSEQALAGNALYKIFDLQTEQFLDYSNAGNLVRNANTHRTDKIVFQSQTLQVVRFDEGGISRTWSMPTPSGTSQIVVYEDLLALMRYVGGQNRIYIYKLTPPGIVLQSMEDLPYSYGVIHFYDANHLVVNISLTGFGIMHFYRIEPDYSLTYLNELGLGPGQVLIVNDAILHSSSETCTVIDTADPDNPVVTQTISVNAGNGSYDGHGHYMFNGWFHTFVFDTDFLPLGYLNGPGLCFYQPGCFLIPGPTGVVKAKVDAIVSNDDNLEECIPPGSIRNYPNPFNPETTIEFTVPKDGKVVVTIYNIKGQKVKELLNKQIFAGQLTVSWDGTDAGGRALGSGLYFAKIQQNKTPRVHKMMLMK